MVSKFRLVLVFQPNDLLIQSLVLVDLLSTCPLHGLMEVGCDSVVSRVSNVGFINLLGDTGCETLQELLGFPL